MTTIEQRIEIRGYEAAKERNDVLAHPTRKQLRDTGMYFSAFVRGWARWVKEEKARMASWSGDQTAAIKEG
jgi:hypothetical protein